MLPKETTTAIVEHELAGAHAWAARRRVTLEWEHGTLELRATLIQVATGEPFYLHGDFQNYREEPPAWTFRGADGSGGSVAGHYPKPSATPLGSTIFHPHRVICAPFNRLAYVQHAGPHADWGTCAQWLSAGGAHVRATTIGDMLAVIARDLGFTSGRMP